MPVLKGISSVMTPELLKVLAEMGHSDQIVIADANFPAASIASHCPAGLIRLDGHDIPRILHGICKLLPLDQYVECPAQVMAKMECDKDMEIPIIDEYIKIMSEAEGKEVKVEYVERFEFYERAKKCYAVIATGETSQYANIILQKGVIKNPE
ncbi:hypothetical protein WA577_002948, partial [Blastocystis sp. JDR]